MKTVHLICAARPNFMKIAPLYHALRATDWCLPVVIWVRQHKDVNMSGDFLDEFGVRVNDVRYLAEGEFHDTRPDAVVVPGDVNASADYAVKAARLGIPVVHLEAGLRSFDRSMPEEINRIVIDHVSEVLLAPSEDALLNLLKEGLISKRKCYNVGNIMIDAFEMLRERIEDVPPPANKPYALVTLHRPSNVDNERRLFTLLQMLDETAQHLPVVLPEHPRLRRRMSEFELWPRSVHVVPPMPYVEFMALARHATIVITDSGGVQEETSYLGVPCATVRENTERPITISHGTNVLIKPDMIEGAARVALNGKWKKGGPIPLWDGHTAERCVAALKNFLLPQRGVDNV